DVRSEPGVQAGSHFFVVYHEKMAACLNAGFTPNIVQVAVDAGIIRSLVACEIGVALLPNTRMVPQAEGVTFVPLVDTPDYLRVDLAMAWIPRGLPATISALIECIKNGSNYPRKKKGGARHM